MEGVKRHETTQESTGKVKTTPEHDRNENRRTEKTRTEKKQK